jgi:hypothetical protein
MAAAPAKGHPARKPVFEATDKKSRREIMATLHSNDNPLIFIVSMSCRNYPAMDYKMT